ncbi:hypothetical protein OPQ81_010507 [Rhizoctonia solani]|nr:hypothetical protein OPQ81_010507 [Rhizoctonia solani]
MTVFGDTASTRESGCPKPPSSAHRVPHNPSPFLDPGDANPWESGTQYNFDDIVEFQGIQYKIIQPHRSQSDWTPDVNPALWGRIWEIPPCQSQKTRNPPPEQRPWDQHDHTKVELSEEEEPKSWYDLEPERRKQIEMGGGLLAGVAILSGGFLACKKPIESEEDKKALAWSLQNWITDAQRRAKEYHQHGPRGPVTWVLTKGPRIPPGAFVAGQEADGTPLYVGRTYFEKGVQLGKVSPNFQKGCVIGYDGDEIEVEDYEILIANPQVVGWAEATGTCDAQFLGFGVAPVEGGLEYSGPLNVVQAQYKDGIHPGKTGPHLHGANITYGGKEKVIDTYRILVYNQ